MPDTVKQLTTSVISDTRRTNKKTKDVSWLNRKTRSRINAGIHFTVHKPGQSITVLNEKGPLYRNSRLEVIKDGIHIKITKTDDTGVYTCHWHDKRIRVWSVTVVRGPAEPIRQIIPQTVYDLQAWRGVLNDIPESERPVDPIFWKPNERPQWWPHYNDSALQGLLLEPVDVIHNNLRVYTKWSAWSPCVPCTPMLDIPHSTEPVGDGFQTRMGVCHVQLLDYFTSTRPHTLALQVNTVLRHYQADGGLPCRAHLIREAMRDHAAPLVSRRPSEMMLRMCVATCGFNVSTTLNDTNKRFHHPKRSQLRIKEGRSTIISCPIRGEVKGPISWFYSPMDVDELFNLTETAVSKAVIDEYGSPAFFITTKLEQINITTLSAETRGRYRVDPALNLLVAEFIADPPSLMEKRLLHLTCVHGDARAARRAGFSDWVGIIDIEVISRSFAVTVSSRIAQITLLIIPFILAIGTFLVVTVAIYSERTPRMINAALGRTNKPVS